MECFIYIFIDFYDDNASIEKIVAVEPEAMSEVEARNLDADKVVHWKDGKVQFENYFF